jgi:hypothetical protein
MPDFNVTDEIVEKISDNLNTPVKIIKDLHGIYQKIQDDMKRHYLAHVIRAMEEKLRNIPGNEMFRIICSPVGENSKNIGITSAHYYKGRYFAIFYHPKTDEKQLRIMLAHELGHLFLVELVNAQSDSPLFNEKTMIEPMSTILGIFTILDKNEFYHNKTAPFKHASPDEVLHDFSLLKNRNKNKLNLS